jgi:hypothetical protein
MQCVHGIESTFKTRPRSFWIWKNMLNPKGFKIGGTKCKLSLEEPPNTLWNVKTRSSLKGRTTQHESSNTQHKSSIVKQGSLFALFCLHLWDPPNRDDSDRILGLIGKLSRRRVASAWLHGIWTCCGKVFEYWMIFSRKIKLNRSWKLQRNWNVPLVLLERSWWAGFNGIYLVRFGFRMWEILIFKWFLPLKFQINSKKPGFERKNQLRTW